MFDNLTINQLKTRMEGAPDFGYDDEEGELKKRLVLQGKGYKWESNTKIVIYDT